MYQNKQSNDSAHTILHLRRQSKCSGSTSNSILPFPFSTNIISFVRFVREAHPDSCRAFFIASPNTTLASKSIVKRGQSNVLDCPDCALSAYHVWAIVGSVYPLYAAAAFWKLLQKVSNFRPSFPNECDHCNYIRRNFAYESYFLANTFSKMCSQHRYDYNWKMVKFNVCMGTSEKCGFELIGFIALPICWKRNCDYDDDDN